MRLFLLGFLLSSFLSIAIAGDTVNYGESENRFIKVRQVAETASGCSVSLGATSTMIRFPKPTLSVIVRNDHGSQSLYVNPNGNIALNKNGSAGTTVAGSNILTDLTFDFTANGVHIGDLIVLDESDSNDGVYSIIKIDGYNIYLDRNLTINHSGNQDYLLQSIPVLHGESLSLDIGCQEFSVIASDAATTARIIVTYQKG